MLFSHRPVTMKEKKEKKYELFNERGFRLSHR